VTCTHDLVKVGWVDADETSGWTNLEDYKKKNPSWIIHTVGYLVEKPSKKTDFYILANSHLPDTGVWGGLNRIPKGMVVSVEVLLKKIPCGETVDQDTSHS
jgi:hypothetical protein